MILKSGFLVSWLIVHESVNNYLALAAIHPAIASQTPLPFALAWVNPDINLCPKSNRVLPACAWVNPIKYASRCGFEAKRMYVAAALEIGERRAAPTLLSAWSLGVTAPSHQLTKPRTLAVPLIAVSGSLCGSVALSLWCP